MIVVSDTGPLNYLTLIGHVELLGRLYGAVIIPPAVALELSRPATPHSVAELIAHPPSWLSVGNSQPSNPQLSGLGEGEQQAILLAAAIQAGALLCDDRVARDAASRLGLRVSGTLGVLRDASAGSLLDFRQALVKLRSTNFRISNALFERLMEVEI